MLRRITACVFIRIFLLTLHFHIASSANSIPVQCIHGPTTPTATERDGRGPVPVHGASFVKMQRQQKIGLRPYKNTRSYSSKHYVATVDVVRISWRKCECWLCSCYPWRSRVGLTYRAIPLCDHSPDPYWGFDTRNGMIFHTTEVPKEVNMTFFGAKISPWCLAIGSRQHTTMTLQVVYLLTHHRSGLMCEIGCWIWGL